MTRSPKRITRLAFLVLGIIISIIILRAFSKSLFFSQRERINVVFYGEETRFFSLSRNEDLHYVLPLYSDLQIQLPGGYGFYRIGAVGKLVNLEKNPDLFRKTFSLASSTFVDYYFYPKTTEIYYGKAEDEDKAQLPSFKEIFMNQSNASFLDRVYLYTRVVGKRPSSFNNLTLIRPYRKQGDTFFSVEKFNQAYVGYFFQKQYRDEKKNAQVIFAEESKTAADVSRILEGNGIRVGDITQGPAIKKGCIVKENSTPYSKSAQAIASFFKCSLQREKTGIYDILFVLGDVETSWETD